MGRVTTFCARDLFSFLVKTTDESEISIKQKFSHICITKHVPEMLIAALLPLAKTSKQHKHLSTVGTDKQNGVYS